MRGIMQLDMRTRLKMGRMRKLMKTKMEGSTFNTIEPVINTRRTAQ